MTSPDATRVLKALAAGQDAADQLRGIVYDDLRLLARRFLQGPGHTLQPTALVHEAYLRLVDQSQVDWRDRSHFFAVGARAMRQILVNHAKAKGTAKRGGGWQRVPLDSPMVISSGDDSHIVAVDEAIEELAGLNKRQAQIVELRFFGGLNMEEVAEVLGLSKRTVEREWTGVRAWLRQRLAEEDEA
jgi:RNA polymerase sigma factor (TIGR02999 family)